MAMSKEVYCNVDVIGSIRWAQFKIRKWTYEELAKKVSIEPVPHLTIKGSEMT